MENRMWLCQSLKWNWINGTQEKDKILLNGWFSGYFFLISWSKSIRNEKCGVVSLLLESKSTRKRAFIRDFRCSDLFSGTSRCLIVSLHIVLVTTQANFLLLHNPMLSPGTMWSLRRRCISIDPSVYGLLVTAAELSHSNISSPSSTTSTTDASLLTHMYYLYVEFTLWMNYARFYV